MTDTVCNGCGACCEVVPLSYSQMDVKKLQQKGEVPEDEAEWVINDLVPLGRRKAKERQPAYFDTRVVPFPPAVLSGELPIMPFFYTCKKWDPETRQCTDYENRPSPCRRYPWYDGDPKPAVFLPPTCSFRVDIGLKVHELEVRTRAD